MTPEESFFGLENDSIQFLVKNSAIMLNISITGPPFSITAWPCSLQFKSYKCSQLAVMLDYVKILLD
jgi:hypothetical protein